MNAERPSRWQRIRAWVGKYRFRIGYGFVVLGLVFALTGIERGDKARHDDARKHSHENALRIYDNCLAIQRTYDGQFIAFDVLGKVLEATPEQIKGAEDLLRDTIVKKYGPRPECPPPPKA